MQVTKFLATLSYPFTWYLDPPRPKYIPQHSVLELPQGNGNCSSVLKMIASRVSQNTIFFKENVLRLIRLPKHVFSKLSSLFKKLLAHVPVVPELN